MTERERILKEIYDRKIVAIFRGIAPEKCAPVAKALCNGGITLMEVTFNQAEEVQQYRSTLDGIRCMVQVLGDNVLVGAGTVIHPKQVVLAYNAGAKYIITPTTDETVIRLARELGMVTMPGAFTATEIQRAHDAGADLVKVFPASVVGPAYFKALKGPLGHIPLTAVGGVNRDNAKDFLNAGAVAVGIGGNLVDKHLIEAGDFEDLSALAAQYVESIR